MYAAVCNNFKIWITLRVILDLASETPDPSESVTTNKKETPGPCGFY